MSNIYALRIMGVYTLQVTADSEEEVWANQDHYIASNLHEIMEHSEFEVIDLEKMDE